jgi:hypothetical protein
LRRNALRKRDASGSCEDDRIVDEIDKIEFQNLE